MKIAFINDSFLRGQGADEVIFQLAKRIGKFHDVTVLTGPNDIKPENFKIKQVTERKLLEGNAGDFLSFFNALKFRKASKEFDVIALHHTMMAPVFWGKKNVLVTYHGSPTMDISENGLRKTARSWVSKISNKSLKSFLKIVAISQFIKNELIKDSIPEEKIVIVPNGARSEIKPSKKDERYMLYVGRAERHKNISDLVHISNNLKFPLLIAGSGPEINSLKIEAMALDAPVEFCGRVTDKDLKKLYQNCSFFVSASLWEGFGLIFLEAASAGKPSVAYNVGAIPDVVVDKETGFLADNKQEFENFVKILIRSKKLRKEMGDNASKFVKKFNWDKIAEIYIELFSSIKRIG